MSNAIPTEQSGATRPEGALPVPRTKARARATLGGAILAALAVYAASFQVEFYQTALVTTFGKPDAGGVVNADGQAAGLYWRWPIIQQVRLFDTRVRVLDDRLEEQQTSDKQTVIVNAYLSWRITDALAFYSVLRTPEQAELQLVPRLRDARSQISNFSFDDLTNADPALLRLAQAEAAMLAAIRADVDRHGYGIEVVSVGIKRLSFSQAVSEKVFERMISTRRRMAQIKRSEGDAAAFDIKSRAESDAQRILAFADRRAQAIRTKGDEAAAQFYDEFKKDEDFAIFLRKLEALKRTLKSNATFILDTNIVPFDLFKEELERRGHTIAPIPGEKPGAGSDKPPGTGSDKPPGDGSDKPPGDGSEPSR